MSIKKILCLLSAALILACMPVRVFAVTTELSESSGDASGSRNIYVGDIINLKITANGLSTEDLRNKFQDFEIIEIYQAKDSNSSGEYLISLRTFVTGEHKITLGDKEIEIHVRSTLEDIQREDIFEGDQRVLSAGIAFHWRVLFFIAAGIFLLFGSFALSKVVLAFLKKSNPPSYYQLFLRHSGSLSPEDDNYFVDLTFYFKKYLESMFQCRIIGKTSNEIDKELKTLPAINNLLPEIREWLAKCDNLKFTGIKVYGDEKQRHYKELLDIVDKINLHTQKEVVS